jgi:hypothetical protein
MKKHRQTIGLRELLDEDLSAICRDLSGELGKMSGNRLLLTGGGGFLGYYLVQSVLHWNDTRAGRDKIDLVVYDNYARHSRLARGLPRARRPDARAPRHD